MWDEHWSYYGTMECKYCDRAEVDWVACSDECREKLKRKTRSGGKG
jgi:predicted nucleic acid-binding Zn ribbon protein